MIGLVIGLALAATTAPADDAAALGRRLAAAGTASSLLPLMAAKETEEIVASQPGLSAADLATLRATAAGIAAAAQARVVDAMGAVYAKALPVADLKLLVAFHESPAAARQRAVLPKVMAATMKAAGAIDFKREVLASFCAKTGKACPPPAR